MSDVDNLSIDEYALELELAALQAKPGVWTVGQFKFETREKLLDYVKGFYERGDTNEFNYVALGDSTKVPASTGNGPTSRANAVYLSYASPENILKLLQEYRMLKARVQVYESLSNR